MKVSDFKLAEHFLELVCKKYKTPFVDVSVDVITDDRHPSVDRSTAWNPNGASFSGDSITLHEPSSLAQTMMGIVGVYINKLSAITGSNVSISDPEQVELMQNAAAMIRAFIYSDDALPQVDPKSGLKLSIRQFAFVWLVMRDIVAPHYRCELRDIPVFCGKAPYLDAAKYFPSHADVGDSDVDVPMIFVNTEVESNIFRQGFLLVETIRAHGLDATRVVADLLTDEMLRKMLFGMTKLAFIEEDNVNDFLFTLAAAGNFNDASSILDNRTSEVWSKQASTSPAGGLGGMWFMPALTETQLAPFRGQADNPIARRMNPYVQDLWNRVSAEKKRRGKEDFTLEDLLRVQSAGMRPEPNRILQHLLGEQRIW